ncbi:F420-dependent methylene-tetrahydromethanopterin reductase, partial [Streptomyces sp. NRRL F-6602]
MTSRPMHLAAHFPGVNNTTVWAEDAQTSPPPAGPGGRQIAFSSFTHLARTAERGLFDFFFLAEGLRLREHQGRIHDLDVVGRPESLTVLTALAATTERLGLAATVNATFNEPYELARRLATLDHLSAGRAAWNVVTSFDAFTGENFRRGGFLD